MPVRPANYRIEKWEAKLSGDALSVVAGKLKPMMLQQITLRFPEIVEVENAVNEVLAEAGTSVILNGSYQSFGRELYRMRRTFSGTQLENTAQVALTKWVARGLDSDTLERIRNTVFALAAPTP